MNGPGSRFLGIDFGWEGKPTGVAALEWTGNSLHSLSLETRAGDDAVLAWIDEFARGNTVAGVDAPLVIPNASGMRDADKLAHAGYGRYHAGCYPASRERRYWQRTTGLCRALEERGFRHGDRMPVQAGGRWQIEVHPHAASVQLFRLDRILKYKKGPVPDRRAELERYRALLLEHARRWTPRLALLSLPSIPAGGAALKAVEDQLDALLCAYIAAHWWFWGRSRNDVLGDAARGYIVVPQRGAAGLPLAGLRETYALAGLDEADMDPDPLAQFQKWFAEARAAGLREPNAMTLATVDASGAPDARIVLLKGARESGFVFFTNYGSAKGVQLAANPSAALVFYWGELERQVRVRGRVRKLSRADSAAYFETRPRGSRLGAWVSRQSHPVSSRAELEQALAGLEARFPDEVPLPPFWGGYRLIPQEIEFWQGRPNRLHDRFLFRKHRRGWSLARLSP